MNAGKLELLSGAGLLTGLSKFARRAVRYKGSSPKLQVLNTGLMTAQSGVGFKDAQADTEFWGRLVESAIGARLANAAALDECELFCWRESNRGVDFVARAGRMVTAIEVKSGRVRHTNPGTFRSTRQILVGGDGIPPTAWRTAFKGILRWGEHVPCLTLFRQRS